MFSQLCSSSVRIPLRLSDTEGSTVQFIILSVRGSWAEKPSSYDFSACDRLLSSSKSEMQADLDSGAINANAIKDLLSFICSRYPGNRQNGSCAFRSNDGNDNKLQASVQ